MKSRTNERLPSLVSGLASGIITQVVYQPIEFMRVRQSAFGRDRMAKKKIGMKQFFIQTKEIFAAEGLLSFYSGVFPSILASGVTWGVSMASYNVAKKFFQDFNEKRGVQEFSWNQLLLSGVFSGVVTNVLSHPLILLKTRMQLNALQSQNFETISSSSRKHHLNGCGDSCCGKNHGSKGIYKSTKSGMKDLLSKGLSEMYIGVSLSIVSAIGHSCMHFVFYDQIKRYYLERNFLGQKREKKELKFWESFLISGITKISACSTFHPLSVVMTRLQDVRNRELVESGMIERISVVSCVKTMAAKEGYRSFYRGIVPHLTKAFPSGALSISLYELILRIMSKVFGNNNYE